jgi:phosphate transport system substrate-binding protein
MTVFWPKWIIRFACCWALAGSPLAAAGQPGTIRRLYVETFVTNAGAENLREDVVAELRKMTSVSLVGVESSADAVLGGGGEIWVKGYRSLNPRSGTLPSHGTPIYTGFLSVELRNPKGETLWSYLVTPGGASDDVSKDLSKRIAKRVAEALDQDAAPFQTAPLLQATTVLKAAGATFPYPVYAKWITNYRRESPAVEIVYDAVGSVAGVRQLLAGGVDLGASDSPEVIRQIAPGHENRYLLFPSVVGAVVPIVNIPGLASDIKFTPETLAGIYLGKIKKWNDPILKQANRGLRLPDLDIVVVHRADGSGTSYAWTDYLSRTSPEWRALVGSSLAPNWPVGRAANGNDGVAKLVKELGGSIGYVEYIFALQNHLSLGKVRNLHGEFVGASLESIVVAASRSVAIGDDFKVSVVDPPEAGAYPITSFTWFIVPAHIGDDTKRNAIADFLRWILGPGQRQAAALGYLALPKYIVSKELDAIGKIH